jgi:hypothetical protein
MMTHSLKLDSLQTIQTGIIENTNRSGLFFCSFKGAYICNDRDFDLFHVTSAD